MATEKGFTLNKPLGALVIALLAGAFFAGTRATARTDPPPRGTPEIAAAVIGAPVQDAVAIAVTAEQVRQLISDMRELKQKLEDTNRTMGELNKRLDVLEAQAAARR